MTRPAILFFSHTDGSGGTSLDDSSLFTLASASGGLPPKTRKEAIERVDALARQAAEPLWDAFEDLHDDREARVTVCYHEQELLKKARNARQDSAVVLHSNIHSSAADLQRIAAALRETRPDLRVIALLKPHEMKTCRDFLADRIMDAGRPSVARDVVDFLNSPALASPDFQLKIVATPNGAEHLPAMPD